MKKYIYEKGAPTIPSRFKITISANGPYLIYGQPPIRRLTIEPDGEGNSWTYLEGEKNYTLKDERTALCRCGRTKNPPYCDGSHLAIDWEPTLTASRKPLLSEAEVQEGADLILTDNETYCAFARFCDAQGSTWNQVEASHDPKQRELAIRTAANCPAGRLKAWDKTTGEPYEPKLEPAIGLLEDPKIGCSAGLWIRGGIPITTEDGYVYQIRNRVTLCRCGESRNKPFCDGTHAPAKFCDNLRE